MCGVSVFGRGIWERVCSGIGVCICACVCVWKGEAVIILVCTADRAGALLWHATRLQSICSNQNKTHQGYTKLPRHNKVANPPRHNGIIALYSPWLNWLKACGGCSLLAASCTLLPNAIILCTLSLSASSCLVFHGLTFLGIPWTLDRRGEKVRATALTQ